ncbi:MAG TPA: LysR family transcriptional regulator [Roseomonas sp.]|jgi:DNA-binding transcriptional LysR family regulator
MERREELIRKLRFRDLQLVLSLDRHRSLQRVASDFALTPPAVTKILQEIERTLRCRLFDRTTRQVTPTPSGEMLVRHAALMLSQLDLLDRQLEGVERGLAGVRRLGVHTYAHPGLLPYLSSRLAERAPLLRLAIVEAGTDALIQMLSDGRVDLVVGRVSARFSASLLRQSHLYSEPGLVVASPGHALAARRAARLEECLQARWTLPAEGSPTRVAIDAMFAVAGLPVPDPVLEIMSLGSVIAALTGGDLLTVLPKALARRLEAHGMIVCLPMAVECDLPAVSLYTLRDGFQDPAVNLVAREVQHFAAPLGKAS